VASYLLRPFARACKEFELLAAHDHIAVAVSGGKDSRSLLELLLRYRRRVPFDLNVTAIHVVGAPAGLPDLTDVLEPWFRRLDVEHHFVPLEIPPEEPLPMGCFRCSWNRRKALFATAVDLGCNKLALGHHADDDAATTLMSLLFSGQLETLRPKVDLFEGRLTVIRPLIHIPAKDLVHYANAAAFPPTPDCPHGQTSQRIRVGEFLQQFGPKQAQIRANLRKAAQRQETALEAYEDRGSPC
jgi:tRNA 2-thiocytidine biosynthesis protein TtcA